MKEKTDLNDLAGTEQRMHHIHKKVTNNKHVLCHKTNESRTIQNCFADLFIREKIPTYILLRTYIDDMLKITH